MQRRGEMTLLGTHKVISVSRLVLETLKLARPSPGRDLSSALGAHLGPLLSLYTLTMLGNTFQVVP